MENWQRLFGRRNRPAWVVLLVCLLLTLVAWNGLRMQAMKNARQQFNLHVRDVVESIEKRLRQHEQILLGGAGLFYASERVTRTEWHDYVERLNLGENYPGILGVGFSQVVQPKDLQAHVAAIRAEGFPDFQVYPAGERPFYTSIIYLEPFSGRNLAAFGYDMMSEATRARAMSMAAGSGKTTISGKVRLVQETHGREQAGFLMYVPIYQRGRALVTPEERWKALLGFVYSPYRADDLMEGILGSRVRDMHFVIYDGDEESDAARIYVSQGERSAGTTTPEISTQEIIRAYGRTWTVRLHSSPEFEAEFHSPLNTIILVLGGGISILLFFLVSFLISRREHAEELAEQMTRDIRANEEKLRESEARIHAIVDGAEHLIISTDTEGVIQSFNHAAESHLGYRAEELIGKHTPALFHDADEVVRHAQELNRAGIPVEPGFEVFVARARIESGGDTNEWTYIRKDGSRFPVSLTVTALRDRNDRVNAFLGIATDITERKHAEEELRKLSRAIEQSPVSVVITDAEGRIEYVNEKFTEVTGYSTREVMGRNPRIVQSGLTPIEVYQDMWRTVLGGRQWRGKLQNRKKNGELFWEEIYISSVRDAEGRITHFVAVKEDITERMKVERMKAEFISTVSHELRTPLTSIRGALALIVGGVTGDLPEAVRPLVDIAHKNSERLILLVNDILDIEKIEAGKMEFDMQQVRLMPLLKQAIEANHAYAEQYHVSYELEDSPAGDDLASVMVRVDANRLMQVLANLLSNAAKFSPAGGRVAVAAERNDKYVRILVKDNGPGIPEEFRSRIFQKFVQADSSDTRKKGGTGLGLSITKAIVEQMDGSIGFDSRPGVLTTFFVEFPIVQEEAVVLSGKEQGSRRKRALICGSDGSVSTELQTMLEQVGLTVEIAHDAAQAKQMLSQQGYAMLALDLDMPGQDGILLIHELRAAKETAAMPIVVISGETNKEKGGMGGVSVVDWISKPVDRAQLEAALKQAVRQASSARPRVLHVEDDPDVSRVVSAIVEEFAEIDSAASLEIARRMLGNNRYDMVILDLALPDGSGMELLPELNASTPPVPVMIFSAHEVERKDMQKVKSVLVKSRTDNAQLLATIKHLIGIE